MLEACSSEQDWANACDAVKNARGGQYPSDWWDKVKLSGMMDRILARWGANSSLTLTPFRTKTEVIKHFTDGKDRSND